MTPEEARLQASNAEIGDLARVLFDLPIMPVAGILEPDAEIEIT